MSYRETAPDIRLPRYLKKISKLTIFPARDLQYRKNFKLGDRNVCEIIRCLSEVESTSRQRAF